MFIATPIRKLSIAQLQNPMWRFKVSLGMIQLFVISLSAFSKN